MPSSDADAARRGEQYQPTVDTRAEGAGIVERRDQEHRADSDDGDALKNTQGTWREPEHVLGIQGITHERDAREKSQTIG
jgi:hypothetical protein